MGFLWGRRQTFTFGLKFAGSSSLPFLFPVLLVVRRRLRFHRRLKLQTLCLRLSMRNCDRRRSLKHGGESEKRRRARGLLPPHDVFLEWRAIRFNAAALKRALGRLVFSARSTAAVAAGED